MFRTRTLSRLLQRQPLGRLCRRPPPGAAGAGGASAATAGRALRAFGLSLVALPVQTVVNYVFHEKKTHSLLEQIIEEIRRSSAACPFAPTNPPLPAPLPLPRPRNTLPHPSPPSVLRLVFHDFFIEVGGPFYPLETGKGDITLSFSGVASNDLPKTVAYIALRGFNERETVSLLGARSIGTVHCRSFLNLLRSRCYNNHTSPSPPSSSAGDLVSPPSPQLPGVKMDYEGKRSCFSTLDYRSLLQGRGILYVDQQLTLRGETGSWVRAYGSDASLFRRDFAKAMMKPSNLGVLIAPVGQVRISCSKTV